MLSTNREMLAVLEQLTHAKEQYFSRLSIHHPAYISKQEAWKHFEQIGLPDAKTERYKNTPITSVVAEALHDTTSAPRIHPIDMESIGRYISPSIDAYQIIVFNGRLLSNIGSYLPLDLLQVTTFQEAYTRQYDNFLKYAYQYDPTPSDALAALHSVFFEEGIWIDIPKNVVLDKPIWIYQLTDSDPISSISYPHILITAAANSQARIIHSCHTIGVARNLTNGFTKIHLSDNARLEYYQLQIQDMQHAHLVQHTHCYQAKSSILNHYSFTWDSQLIRNNLYCTLDGAYSHTHMYGLYCLGAGQHVDNHTTVDHKQPHAQSNEMYKGILSGEGTGVFNGRICVRKDAQDTYAFQSNRNVLVSPQATMHSKPQLEIWADEVKCSHGATMGYLNENELFYLRARGIPAAAAYRLLLEAFASEVINKVPLVTLQKYLYSRFMDHIKSLDFVNITT